jgi:hypothetical protein
MARLLCDLLQNYVAQIARAKQTHWPAAAAKSPATFTKLAKTFPSSVTSMAERPATMFIVPMSLSTAFFFAAETSEMLM